MQRRKEQFPDSKVHGANMEATWVLSAADGPRVGHMNLAIREFAIFQWHMDALQIPVYLVYRR